MILEGSLYLYDCQWGLFLHLIGKTSHFKLGVTEVRLKFFDQVDEADGRSFHKNGTEPKWQYRLHHEEKWTTFVCLRFVYIFIF